MSQGKNTVDVGVCQRQAVSWTGEGGHTVVTGRRGGEEPCEAQLQGIGPLSALAAGETRREASTRFGGTGGACVRQCGSLRCVEFCDWVRAGITGRSSVNG